MLKRLIKGYGKIRIIERNDYPNFFAHSNRLRKTFTNFTYLSTKC